MDSLRQLKIAVAALKDKEIGKKAETMEAMEKIGKKAETMEEMEKKPQKVFSRAAADSVLQLKMGLESYTRPPLIHMV
jgi:hypothetical protein